MRQREEYYRKRRKTRYDQGLCESCGNPRHLSFTRCSACREKNIQSNKTRTERLRAEKKCISCGGPKEEDFFTCSICINKERSRCYSLRVEVLDHYGGKCACCGEAELKFLCVDHINNDGAEHRRQIGTAATMWKWIIDSGFPDTFQVLCRNCNWGKQTNGGICPHQSKEKEMGNECQDP